MPRKQAYEITHGIVGPSPMGTVSTQSIPYYLSHDREYGVNEPFLRLLKRTKTNSIELPSIIAEFQ